MSVSVEHRQDFSAENFQRLVDGSLVGMMVHRYHRPLYLNRAWAELHGFSVAEVLAMDTILDLIHPDERRRLAEYNRRRLSNQSAPSRYKYRALHRDGQVRWFEILTHAATWDGAPAVVNKVIDVEEQVREHAHLESLVSKRTAELEISSAELDAQIIERKHAQAALDMFKAVVRASQDALFLLTDEFRYIEASKTHLDFLGCSAEDVLGRELEGAAGTAFFRTIEPGIQRARLGETHNEQFWVPNRDLGRRYIDFHYDPVMHANGDVAGILVSAKDLTDLKLAEQELRVLESVVSQVGDRISLIDLNFRYRFTNKANADFHGKRDLVGRHVLETVGEERFNNRVRRQLEACFAGNRISYQHDVDFPTGERRRLDVTLEPFRETDGAISGSVATVRDITEQWNAEEALRISEQHFRSVVEGARQGLFIHRGNEVVFVNRALGDIFGLEDLNELYALEGLHDLAIPEEQDKLRELSRARAERDFKDSSEFVFEGRKASGEPVHVQCYDQPIQWNGLTAVKTVVVNITERERAEKEHRRLESELRQAQKMQAIGQLTGGIAHDFNNLLTSVLGFSSLARMVAKTGDQEKLMHYLEEVERAGGRGRDLVLQMLTFARGGQSTPELFHLGQRCQEATRLLRPTLPASVTLHLEESPTPVTVNLAPNELDQIVMNLCINARDAMDGRGDIRVRISRETLENTVCASCAQPFAGRFSVLTFTDSGPGIAPGVQSRIFDPFFSTKPAGHGTGLGLSTVHGIVHRANGHMALASSEHGLSIAIYLPEHESPQDNLVDCASESASPGRANQTLNILVVDDESSVARFIGELLQTRGHQVRIENVQRRHLGLDSRETKRVRLVGQRSNHAEPDGRSTARGGAPGRPPSSHRNLLRTQ